MWKAIDQMDRAELLEAMRSFNPFGDYSQTPDQQLRETLSRYAASNGGKL